VLSILIPTYNYDCEPLVSSLVKQIDKYSLACEIICIDDASTTKINTLQLNSEYFTSIVLEKNIGRSRIRNLLASKAKYNWILFLDVDTLPTQSNFLSNYIEIIQKNPKEAVFFGGLAYRNEDANPKNSLRYKYGIVRESISSSKRSKNPYTTLLMSNTLLKKKVFDKTGFNEKITAYGHEDAVFSFDLYGAGFTVRHLDNKVYHVGLESNTIFINKTKIAVKNLWYLYMQSLIHPEINMLLKTFIRMKKYGLSPILSFIYTLFHNNFEKKLQQESPSLRIFDLYRLSYLCHVSNLEK